jgi:hypothetical protein
MERLEWATTSVFLSRLGLPACDSHCRGRQCQIRALLSLSSPLEFGIVADADRVLALKANFIRCLISFNYDWSNPISRALSPASKIVLTSK